jgi:hypothetical protein
LAGFLVPYETPEQTQRAFDQIKYGKFIINTTEVQAEVEFTGTYSLHRELYGSFKLKIDETIDQFSKEVFTGETHHVRNCIKNPGQDYFVDKQHLKDKDMQRDREKYERYLQLSIQNAKIRQMVREAFLNLIS